MLFLSSQDSILMMYKIYEVVKDRIALPDL